LTWVYLRHGVWGAAAFHGGVNAFAGVYFLLYPPEPVWLFNPAGVMGVLGWIPLALYAVWDMRRGAAWRQPASDTLNRGLAARRRPVDAAVSPIEPKAASAPRLKPQEERLRI
jgi:hypothetical protein